MKKMNSVFSLNNLIIILLLFLLSGTLILIPAEDAGGSCKKTTQAIRKSTRFKTKSEYWGEIANCNNISNSKSRKACIKKAKRNLKDALEERKDIFDAQSDVCKDIGKSVYEPSINPVNFASTIDNQYYPLTPETTYVYNNSRTAPNTMKSLCSPIR